MIVIVCGGRDFTNASAMYHALDAFEAEHGPITRLIEGGQRTKDSDTGITIGGADYWAASWAWMERHRVEHVSVPADWKRLGKRAGPIRNTRMLVEGEPDYVIAMPGGAGTANMVRQAKAAGVPVWMPGSARQRNLV